MELGPLLNGMGETIATALERYLPVPTGPAGHIGLAARHMLGAGKRLRPVVVMRAAKTFGLEPEAVLPTACAFELVHTATLIHDDLPCIDNSPLRRGRPSCHTAFDEATAVLTGDALIIAAFSAVIDQGRLSPTERVVQVAAEFAAAVQAVIAGEAADIRGERLPPDRELLHFIHTNKTGALFVSAARAGAILAGADLSGLAALTDYGERVGLLFQAADDILDESGVEAELGKPTGADAAAGKQTYPAVMGLEVARRQVSEIAAQARESAANLPAERDFWRALVDLIITRRC